MVRLFFNDVWVNQLIAAGAESSLSQGLVMETFLAAALFTLGFYHIALSFVRKQDGLSLLAGAYCIFLAIRALLSGGQIMLVFYPQLSKELVLRFEYLGPILGVPILCHFIRTMYPEESKRWILNGIMGVGFLFALSIILVPPHLLSSLMLPFQGFLLIAILYVLLVLGFALARGQEGAKVNLAVSVLLIGVVVHDYSYYSHRVFDRDLTAYGVLLFFFIQTLIVARKFNKAYYDVERISAELAQMNQKLEEKIKDRTAALEVSNAYLVYANEHLNRVENSRRELIANITHELGTPMTSIQGYMKALLDGVITPDKQYIQIIYDKIQIAERLVQDLFDLTKLEAGQTTFHLVDVIVDELFEEYFSVFQWDVENQGITFKLEIPHSPDDLLPILRIDPIRIRQVVTNLVNNAVNYTPEGGQITISGEYTAGRLIIRVTDTGKGIDPALLPHIFDRFVKGSNPRRNKRDGTGLGLAIAKEIILHHGGIMNVSSEPGKGSVFQFDLPVEFIPMVVD